METEDLIWKIQECLEKPKPSKWFFSKPRKIRSCYECAFYGICELTRNFKGDQQ
jgi:CRISPR/Cas system-associated exonuclease Cas4 (RecB family)